MSIEKALALGLLAVVTVIALVFANMVGAWLVSYAGTLGLGLMPVAVVLILYLVVKMWQVSLRKLFPTKKESK